MDDPDVDLRTALAGRLADAARAAILPRFRTGIAAHDKGDALIGYDPVTEADTAAETAMRTLLAREVPQDAILGEELGNQDGTSGWTWVLDPIDGTRAFLAGTPTWGVLIAACRHGIPVIGVIDQPWIGERWTGTPGGTEWSRESGSLHVRTHAGGDIGGAILATTDPFLFSGASASAFEHLRNRAPITRYGLDCLAYGLLASGCIGLVVESGLKPVDVAALVPVVHGAGGLLTSWSGEQVLPLDPWWDGTALAAANAGLHVTALAVLSGLSGR
jgi:histidinol phosphatase-like enzyme (inositol monophosphatase family)